MSLTDLNRKLDGRKLLCGTALYILATVGQFVYPPAAPIWIPLQTFAAALAGAGAFHKAQKHGLF